MNREDFRLKGQCQLVLKKENGDVIVKKKDNIIVNGGFDFICDALGKASGRPNVLSHIAVGKGTTAAAAGQTALVSEITRVAATYAHTAGTKEFTMTANYAKGIGSGAITELGVFNAASGGTMFDRVVFAVVNKEANDELTVTFRFVLSQP